MSLLKKILTDKIAIVVFLAVWELSARLGLVNSLLVPAFSKVVVATWKLLIFGPLIAHIVISLERALGGFLIAAAVAIPLGFLMGGWFRKLELTLNPLFDIAAQVNPFILFHVIILFLGIGEAAKISIIAWICIWPILLNTSSGIRNINPVLSKSAQSFGLGRWAVFTKVILPSAAPAIFTGLRLSAGYSFFLLIAAEMMGSNSGLGWFVLYSQENYTIDWIFSGALVIALLGLSIDKVIQYIEKKIVVWE